MKKIIALFAAVLLTMSAYGAVGDTFNDGTLNYRVTQVSPSYEVAVTGFYNGAKASVTIPDQVANGGVTYDVTSLADWAFSYIPTLTSITLGNKLKTIGYAVLVNTEVTSLSIPANVEWVADAAFREMPKLQSVHIASAATTLVSNPFLMCSRIESFTGPLATEDHKSLIQNNVLEAVAPYGCTEWTVPEGVTTIPNYLFSHCSNLTSITLPSTLTTVGNYGFRVCSSLQTMRCNAVVPPTVGAAIFMNTPVNNGELIVPFGSVANYAAASQWNSFKKISSVPSIDDEFTVNGLTYKVTKVSPDYEVEVSQANPALTDVVVPDDVTFEGYTFAVTGIGQEAFSLGSGEDTSNLESVTIGSNVKTIGNYAFFNCKKLDSVTFASPSSLTNIGNGAFHSCTQLQTISLPESLGSIEFHAFYQCTGLESITLPSTLTYIGNEALAACTSLKTLQCDAVTPPALGDDVFDGIDKSQDGCELIVPADSKDAYKAADQWGAFSKTTTGIETIAADDAAAAPARYYDLRGIEVTGLTPGLYIRRCGTRADKVLVK